MWRLHLRLAIAVWAISSGWIALMLASSQLGADERGAKPGAVHHLAGGTMGGPAAMPIFLLGSPKVQKELGLSEEQKAKLKDLAANYFREIRQRMGDLRDLPEQQRMEELAKAQKKIHAEGRGLCKKIDEVLSSYQRERFKQVLLQVRGVTALGDKDIAAALALTEQQKQGLKAVGDSAREKLADLRRQRGDLEWQQVREKAQAIQRESTEKALALLTREQKERFEEMQGPVLDLDLLGLMQGAKWRGKR